MRHVGKKLRFVLRRKRKLLGLLFHRPARLFDFPILRLDLGLLLRKQRRLFTQLVISVSELFLLIAQKLFGLAKSQSLLLKSLVGLLELVLLTLKLGRQ